MKKICKEIESNELIAMKNEINDLFTIYLDCEIASDTTDRRQKLVAITTFNKCFI